MAGAQAEIRVLQDGKERKVRVTLQSPQRLIPVHILGRPPSYFILGGLVFTQVRAPDLAWVCRHLSVSQPHCKPFCGDHRVSSSSRVNDSQPKPFQLEGWSLHFRCCIKACTCCITQDLITDFGGIIPDRPLGLPSSAKDLQTET